MCSGQASLLLRPSTLSSSPFYPPYLVIYLPQFQYLSAECFLPAGLNVIPSSKTIRGRGRKGRKRGQVWRENGKEVEGDLVK
jgi:hypothetical protein